LDIVQLEKKLIKKIKTISKSLDKYDPLDRQQLIALGKQFEEIKTEIPYDFVELIAIFIMCLEGLEGIYNNQISHPENLVKAEANAFLYITNALESNNKERIKKSILKAGHELWIALGRAAKDSPYLSVTEKIVNDKRPELILNDVAALFMQLNPSDIDDFKKIKPSLEIIENNKTVTPIIRDKIKIARKKIERIIKNPDANNASEFTEINNMIAQSLAIMDENPVDYNENVPQSTSVENSGKQRTENKQEFSLPSDFDSDIINEFIAESKEYLEDAESALLQLEKNPNDAEAINVVFRAFHTIKGTSGFLQLDLCSNFAHVAESFFSRIRDEEVVCTGKNADLSLRSIDMVKSLVRLVEIALDGKPLYKPDGYDELIKELSSSESETAALPEEKIQLTVEKEPEYPAEPTFQDKPQSQTVVEDHDIAESSQSALSDLTNISFGKDAFVRVRTDRLDGLIEMVGELVIAQSMISQDEIVVNETAADFTGKVVHAGKIVRDLQDLSLLMRMIPLSGTFQKMARLVRDLSHKTGKMVKLSIQGEDTEIDRKMVELIKDPIIHMIRNAMDHGFESVEERIQNGKSKVGNLRISAFHSGGNVILKIIDDGRGLDREKIIKKAIEKGIIENDINLDDNEIFNLIFAPGFSTADKVTNVSGRGVGLDVVKKNIEELHGRIDLTTVPGKGCTFTLSFPLTIAIIDGMLVKIGDERFIVPIIDIQMSLQPSRDALFSIAQRGEMIMFQNRMIPIFRLHQLFNIKNAIEDPTHGLLVIIGDGERRCALLVDQLLGQQQVVTKSLGEELSNIKGISGGAILGDGRVGLILDTSEISALARESVTNKIDYKKTEKLYANT